VTFHPEEATSLLFQVHRKLFFSTEVIAIYKTTTTNNNNKDLVRGSTVQLVVISI